MKILILRLSSILLLTVLSLSFGGASALAFDPLATPCQGNSSSAVCQGNQTQNGKGSDPVGGPGGIISTAANIIALVAGVAAVIMVMLGAFAFVTSGGNQESIAKAKGRISSGLIGLIIVSLAWAIARFITDRIIR